MAAGVETVLDGLEVLPPRLFGEGAPIAARLPQRSFYTVTTNVPGPQVPLFLLGRRMLEMVPYIPLAMGLRVTIGIVTYDGHVAYGVTGDADAVPDLDVLCDGIDAATAELVAAAQLVAAVAAEPVAARRAPRRPAPSTTRHPVAG